MSYAKNLSDSLNSRYVIIHSGIPLISDRHAGIRTPLFGENRNNFPKKTIVNKYPRLENCGIIFSLLASQNYSMEVIVPKKEEKLSSLVIVREVPRIVELSEQRKSKKKKQGSQSPPGYLMPEQPKGYLKPKDCDFL